MRPRMLRGWWLIITAVAVAVVGCRTDVAVPGADDAGNVGEADAGTGATQAPDAEAGDGADGSQPPGAEASENDEGDGEVGGGDDAAAVTGYGRPPQGPGVVRVNQQAHLYPPRTVGDGAIVGVLGADMDMEGGCLWLERDGERYGLTWFAEQLDWDHPEAVRSYWARFYDDGSPAELVTSDGTVLAREGDEVELTGGEVAIEELASSYGYDLTCQLGDETLVVAHPDAEQAGWLRSPDFEEPGVDKVVQLAHTYPGTTGIGQALIGGTLRADPDLDGGCFWLEGPGGEVPIVWASGYLHPAAYLSEPEDGWDDAYWSEPEERRGYWGRFYDDGSPAEVVSTEGEVLAREGDEVEFGGGIAPLDGFEGYDLPCLVNDDLVAVYPSS